jgi:hypothetical protein
MATPTTPGPGCGAPGSSTTADACSERRRAPQCARACEVARQRTGY